jgi:predicted TIM-barrel fold metal-dependent hydrolase
MLFSVKPVDEVYYRDRLADFLPDRMIDVHTHVWRDAFMRPPPGRPPGRATAGPKRSQSWPALVAKDNPIEDLVETYRLLFPAQTVTPVIFGSPRREVDLAATNGYVSRVAGEHGFPALMVSTPDWTADELAQRVTVGGFRGLKPYLSFAPPEIPAGELTVFDFLPRSHLEVADDHGWVVMLHLPRPDRLRDPVNLDALVKIDRRYPRVVIIVAHVGRAYCDEDVGGAFEVLGETENLRFDFSANTNAGVMAGLLRAVGPQRVLFGSDMPILRMRMRRICEDGRYVNLVPPGLYGDVTGDPHMREVTSEAGARLSFFMYEELWAFRRAAEAVGLTSGEVRAIFYDHAARLFELEAHG